MSKEVGEKAIYAGIDSQGDITVYLTTEQCGLLMEEELRGRLVKIEKPTQQGGVILMRDEERATGLPDSGSFIAFGIGVERTDYGFDRVGDLTVFLNKDSYEKLIEVGDIGRRYGTQGSKVEVINIDSADRVNKQILDNWKFYVGNRDGLIEAGL